VKGWGKCLGISTVVTLCCRPILYIAVNICGFTLKMTSVVSCSRQYFADESRTLSRNKDCIVFNNVQNLHIS